MGIIDMKSLYMYLNSQSESMVRHLITFIFAKSITFGPSPDYV